MLGQPPAAVPDGVRYTGVLRTPTYSPLLSVLGLVIGLGSFYAFAPLIVQVLAGAYWTAIGSPGEFADTYRALVAYELPFGITATQLGIAVLLPVSLGLLAVVHRIRPAYLSSVRPGLRWRPLLVFTLVALVTLNGVLVAQNLLAGRGFEATPQRDLGWFLLAVVATTPLQAAAEEYFFRGYLMQSLGALVSNHWFGIVASALVFALFHGTQNIWLFLDRFAFGVLSGILVVRTGGLEAGIAAHVINNLFAYLYAGLTTGIPALKRVQTIGPWEAAGDVVMFGVFAAAALLVATRLRLATRTGEAQPV